MREHINALRRQRAEAHDRMQAAVSKAEAENRDLTAEEAAAFSTDKAAVKAFDARLERAEEVEREAVKTAAPILTTDHKPAVTVGQDNTEARPWGPTPAASFGAFLKAVRNVESVGIANMDARLRPQMSAAASGANESIGSEGAFVLGTEMTAYINKSLFEVGVLTSRATRFMLPTGTNKVSLKLNGETSRVTGSRWGGVQVYWRAEAGTVTAKKPAVREVDAKLESLMGLYYDTAEADEDSIIGQIAMQAFPEELAAQLDLDIFSGHGAGKPLGFSTSSGRVTQAKETGQTADTIVAENVINMWSRMPARARMNAVWLVGCDTEPQLVQMTLPGGGLTPYPLYMPPGGLSASPYGTLFGRPVIPFEHCSALGDEGDIVLADPSWYLLLLNGNEAKAESSIHIRFLYNENAYRWVYRVNGLPMVATPFTAANGVTTLSPFVTLAARA